MIEISLKQARSFIIESQLLSHIPKVGRKNRALRVFHSLGYVQIDTISVVSRSHHHILWSRVHNYEKRILEKLEQDRHIFEYWAHAASYLPMRDYRFTLVPKQKILEGPGHWWPKDQKWINLVYDRIKAEGGLMSKDFKKDPNLAYDHPWGGHPVTQAIRQLFMEGRIMISGRKGFQKVYDLTERVLPEHVDQSMPTRKEYYIHLIKRDLRANGIMRATEIGHLISIPRNQLMPILDELIEDDLLLKVRIKRLDDQVYYALKDHFNHSFGKTRHRQLHILSPFDNLIIQRKRLKELFGFEYILECYVPAAKRKVGYYSLPILLGSEFVGQIDLKADRRKEVLVVKNIVWENKIKNREQFEIPLKKRLLAYCVFNDCESITVDEKVKNPINI